MKVLLAIDASKGAQAVLEEAMGRTWPAGTSFCLLSIVDLNRWEGMPELVEDARRAANLLIDAAKTKLTSAGFKVETQIRLGFPHRAINKYAREWGADLIMVGSRGLNEVTRFLLGSVAQSVLRDASCSVEIVRPHSAEHTSGVRPMRILLATDGSECSLAAVQAVAYRPWPAGTQVKIVTVVQLVTPEAIPAYSSLCPEYPASLLDEIWKEAHLRATEALKDARKTLGAAGLDLIDGAVTPFGEPRAVILDQAASWPADLIVLGSHGRHGLDRVLMGSVSEAVALHANCSVEVERPRGLGVTHKPARELTTTLAFA